MNYETGVIRMMGATPVSGIGQTLTDISFLGIPGVDEGYVDLIDMETVRYNAVAYSFLPLDAALLGIDPVRLPSDGRVPMFRPGGLVVTGHTETVGPLAVDNAQVVDLERTRLSRVKVIGADGATINTGYTFDLEDGAVTFTDVAGYSQPVTIEHRIEDYVQIRETLIDGTLVLMRPLTHNYPMGSYISSAFRAGDLRARTSLVFDQATWSPEIFSDALTGNAAVGTYNDTAFPITVTNAGALTERYVLRFTSTTAFQIIGEHVGVIGTGNTSTETAPANPNSEDPLFRVPAGGWGAGWVPGNILRINTVGALPTFWLARTVKQGSPVADDYGFSVLVRGSVDNPLP